MEQQGGIIFRGKKVVVPSVLRYRMLEIIHEGHLGIEKCKARAREILFWPGMTREIEDRSKTCTLCLRFSRKNQKEPLMPHPVPDAPWSKVGADIMTFKGLFFKIY